MKKFQGILSLVFLISFTTTVAQNATLNGTVKEEGTSDPIAGVHVLLTGVDSDDPFRAVVTNPSGQFNMESIPYGEYRLTASHVGYELFRSKLQIRQPDETIQISMPRQMVDLGEVIVSSLHQEKRIKHVSMPMEVLNELQAETMPVFSPSEMLESQPGIALRDDGIWAASVNIRGLNEQRIVALVDGNRIETATDIAAGLSMIDMSELQRIEVIKGASSSLYGTGAMGGVINFVTKKGQFSDNPYTKGVLQSQFHSVNDMYAQKFAVEGGNHFGHFRIGGKIRRAADVKTPKGILLNSQFQDNSLSFDVGVKPWDNHIFNIQYQRFLARDVGIPGGEPFPEQATATYPEELRNLISAGYELKDPLPFLNELSVKYYHQYILRDVLLEPNVVKTAGNMRITPEKTMPTGKHNTNGLQLRTNWSVSDNHELTGGFDLWQRQLNTEREKHITQEVLDNSGHPIDTISLVIGETPIPNSRFGSAGVFLQDEFYLWNDNLKVTIGGRYDFIRVYNEQATDPEYMIRNGTIIEDPPNQVITFQEQTVYNKSWSTNLGLLYHVFQDIDITLNVGKAFRSPSIEERYKYIDLGNLVRLGDPELMPEDGYSYDLGFRIWKPRLNVKVNGFLNEFSNLVVEQPGTYIKEYQSGTADTLDALINENVDEARLYGFDLQFTYNVIPHLNIHGNASYVRGRDTKNEQNLPLIPPLNGRIGLRYTFDKYGSVDLTSVLYDQQDKVAINEQTTSGYVLFDISVASKKIDFNYGKLKIYGGIENVLDEAYRNHLSSNRGTLDWQPGRNFYLKMQLEF